MTSRLYPQWKRLLRRELWDMHRRPKRKARGRLPIGLAFLALSIPMSGCNFIAPPSRTSEQSELVRPDRIIAQGQILPANGLIRLAATPGDTVVEVHVRVGDHVTASQPLVVMHSLKLLQSQLEALNRRYEDAQQQQSAAIEQARLRVASAELKVSQAESQLKAVERQNSIVQLVEDQVDASRKLLQRMEAITNEPLTKNFIGGIEVDRQRLAVADAELKLRQQIETIAQAREAAAWAETAAGQELTAAQSSLQLAMDSNALAALESERETLQIQIAASTLVAPRDAVVVAVNCQVGESAAQYPLIELAEINKVVCAVEVVEADAALVLPNQTATITSPALPRELRGTVLRRDRLVGRPQLPSADPLAKADYRTTNVIVELQGDDATIASDWLHLQVSAVIDVSKSNPDSDPSQNTAHTP
jgi:ABC exporter DevB family membrane fusion protein